MRQRLSTIAAHVVGSAGDTKATAVVLLDDGSVLEPESFEYERQHCCHVALGADVAVAKNAPF